MWFGASNIRERGKGESLRLQNFAAGRPMSAPFEALPAWIAGTSPAMTARARYKSQMQKCQRDRPLSFFHASARVVPKIGLLPPTSA
jgi:hypothetical protein